MAQVHRIIDANANRAREALRVMEEAARFILDRRDLCESIKQLRHDLAAALSRIPALEANRDTPGDVGTTITTQAEQVRAGVADVAIAAGKRLSEALRAIEEYAKALPGEQAKTAAIIEQLRYRGYDVEQLVNQALGTRRAKQWRLCVLISESLCRDRPWLNVAEQAVAGGADCIQLREKTIDANELLRRSRLLVSMCHAHDASVIINDRPDVALLSGADGVHLGQTDLPCREVRKLVGRQLLVGVSTSRIDQAKQAQSDGADYCGVGPMFNTTTKKKDIIVGPDYLREYVTWNALPHLAIGGIGVDNVRQLTQAGVQGIAVSSAVCAADDPQAAAKALLEAMGE